MEDILRKREQKLIKEGLNFIDSFEEYTSKNNPDIYKKYLDLRDKKLISFSDKWRKNMIILNNIKDDIRSFNFDDMFTEMENYINTYKPKVFLKREDINQICDIVNIINEISNLPDQSRINYKLKCYDFLRIRSSILDRINLSD